MQWAIIDSNSVVRNIIAYDGVSDYIPPAGMILTQIDDNLAIGMKTGA